MGGRQHCKINIFNYSKFCNILLGFVSFKRNGNLNFKKFKNGAKWVIVEMLTKLCEISELKYFISCKGKADVKRVATMRYKSLFAFYLKVFRTFTDYMKTYQYPITTI